MTSSAPWLTRTGMVLGTPAYMAPEQAAGDATMASDQFSFCVTAWEAFTRQRPFAGTTTAELLANIRAGSVTEPEGERALPPPIDAALRRGLAADPAQRFPSMTALLSALEPSIARALQAAIAAIWMAALARGRGERRRVDRVSRCGRGRGDRRRSRRRRSRWSSVAATASAADAGRHDLVPGWHLPYGPHRRGGGARVQAPRRGLPPRQCSIASNPRAR